MELSCIFTSVITTKTNNMAFAKLNNGQVGEIVSNFRDGGDYETQVQNFVTIETPEGNFFSASANNVKEVEYSEYLDLIGLNYGIFY